MNKIYLGKNKLKYQQQQQKTQQKLLTKIKMKSEKYQLTQWL